jgi:hypothetical protein
VVPPFCVYKNAVLDAFFVKWRMHLTFKPLEQNISNKLFGNDICLTMDGRAVTVVSAIGVQSRKLSNVSRSSDIISSSCFGRHVKPLIPAAFTDVSSHPSAQSPCGESWYSFCVIHTNELKLIFSFQ